MSGVQVEREGEVGKWGDECSVNGRNGERLLSTLSPTFFENIDRGSCNNVSRQLIPVFHNPHRKCRPSLSVVACTSEYLVGVPSLAASSGRKEKQIRINIRKGSNQVSPKSSPLQGMKCFLSYESHAALSASVLQIWSLPTRTTRGGLTFVEAQPQTSAPPVSALPSAASRAHVGISGTQK